MNLHKFKIDKWKDYYLLFLFNRMVKWFKKKRGKKDQSVYLIIYNYYYKEVIDLD